jgi:hypothetical protein
MFELGKILSFFLGMLSLLPVLVSAFFEPGSHWEDRLVMSLIKVAFAACACFGSGLFFLKPASAGVPLTDRLLQTLPVRMFFWALGVVVVMFFLSWYLEEYFVPLMWRNQPHEMMLAPIALRLPEFWRKIRRMRGSVHRQSAAR